MDFPATRPSLLSAARNFMRKSAGTAVLAIAPLAAVSLAPEAGAQTLFGTPGFNVGYGTGSASITENFPEPNRFRFPGSAVNNLTTTRLGVDGTLTTTGSGNATVTLEVFSAISNLNIPASTVIPLDYDFTLTKQAGTIGNVAWSLNVQITGQGITSLASGTLTTGSATFTGSGNYTTSGLVVADNSKNILFLLSLNYSSPTASDVLAFQMNSASQGYTINAVAVPEPSTYAVILGLGALGFVALRRSRRPAA
jgi:hypothetical protein